MRFLIDNALSPQVADLLAAAGHDAVHVRTLGLAGAEDSALFDLAEQDHRTIVSADTDFSAIIASRGANRPSIINLRRYQGRRPAQQADLLLRNLATIAEDLGKGAVVVFDVGRIRVRRLPIAGSS